MREHLLPENQIFLFENVIDEEKMKDLKKYIDEHATEEEKLGEGSNVQGMTFHLNKLQNEKHGKYWDDVIYKIVTNICNSICKRIKLNQRLSDSGYQLRKIHGPTREHVDDVIGIDSKNVFNRCELRLYSLIIALNSDYEGGEFHFPEQDTIIKLKAGQAIVFPPYWTHPHYTGELNGTFRYTINTWLTKGKLDR